MFENCITFRNHGKLALSPPIVDERFQPSASLPRILPLELSVWAPPRPFPSQTLLLLSCFPLPADVLIEFARGRQYIWQHFPLDGRQVTAQPILFVKGAVVLVGKCIRF